MPASNNNSTIPPWLNTGDNAWQLTAGTLVGLQSVPGLVVLYAGIVKTKWRVNSAFMAFYAFAAVLASWVIWAYKMGFGKQWAPFVGVPGPLMTIQNELDQSILPASGLTAQFPISTMAYFQFVFAAITVVIIAGAFLGRMNFLAWMLFVPLWITFSYTVGAFSLWGGGFLGTLGVIDYSGGYVIHLSSGTAGFVGAAWIGRRLKIDRENFHPDNVLLTLVGAGILWVGWNGFNGGDPYAASADAGAAVLNTNVATSISILVWIILDMLRAHKASVIGAVQGMITGLVAITPAAGVVDAWGAVIIGVLASTIVWVSLNIIRNFTIFNSFTGGMSVGVLATKEGCAAFGLTTPGGAIEGNWRQVWVQFVGALFIIGLNVVMTSLIFIFIKFVLRVKLRLPEDKLLIGDNAVHAEFTYSITPSRLTFPPPANANNIVPGEIPEANETDGNLIALSDLGRRDV